MDPNPLVPAAASTATPWPNPPILDRPQATTEERSRRWLTGLLGIAGGFVVLTVAIGQLPQLIAGFSGAPPSYTVLLVAQALFGLALVVTAYLVSPAPLPSRLIAVAIVVLGVVVVIVLQVVRLTVPGNAMLLSIVSNPPAWLVLLGGLGWLIAVRARPRAYLGLAATILLFLPIMTWMVMAGVESAVSTLVMQVLALVVALVILVVGALDGRRASVQSV